MRLAADFVAGPARHRLDVTSADGTTLAVQVRGPDGAPTVLLGHGWTLSAGFWGRVVHRLGPDVRTVVYDQRGHGRSGPVATAGCTPRALADDLAAVLTATVPDGERAVVAGHSMGAMALVALAGEHPQVLRERVAAALLASTGVGRLVTDARVLPAPRPLRRITTAVTRVALADPLTLPLLPVPLARPVIGHMSLSRTAPRDVVAYCTDVVRACPTATRTGFARMLAALDLGAHLPALDVPALVLCGTHDRLTPISHSRRLAQALPQSLGLMVVPGAGHMTPVQSPDEVTAAIHRLVRDHLLQERAA